MSLSRLLSSVSFFIRFPAESELFILFFVLFLVFLLKCLKLPSLKEVSEAKDMIKFWLSSSLERKASSPKPSLRIKQVDVPRQRRSPSSPSQGKCHYVIHNSFLSTH